MRKLVSIGIILLSAAGCSKQSVNINSVQQKGNFMLTITSPAFLHDEVIPDKYSCKGESINPELRFLEVPKTAKSLALILHDPDAPREGGFTHWVLFNISPVITEIPENSSPVGATQGNNGAGKPGYTGPCPPSGTHHYHFMLYALDSELNLPSGSNKAAVEQAMKGHILEQGELIGLFTH